MTDTVLKTLAKSNIFAHIKFLCRHPRAKELHNGSWHQWRVEELYPHRQENERTTAT